MNCQVVQCVLDTGFKNFYNTCTSTPLHCCDHHHTRGGSQCLSLKRIATQALFGPQKYISGLIGKLIRGDSLAQWSKARTSEN